MKTKKVWFQNKSCTSALQPSRHNFHVEGKWCHFQKLDRVCRPVYCLHQLFCSNILVTKGIIGMFLTTSWKIHIFSQQQIVVRVITDCSQRCMTQALAISLPVTGINLQQQFAAGQRMLIFSLKTGGCQMVANQSLALCDWCLIDLILHFYHDSRTSKTANKLMSRRQWSCVHKTSVANGSLLER